MTRAHFNYFRYNRCVAIGMKRHLVLSGKEVSFRREGTSANNVFPYVSIRYYIQQCEYDCYEFIILHQEALKHTGRFKLVIISRRVMKMPSK